jgi:hypothetical protein
MQTTAITQGIAGMPITVGILATALTQQLQGRQEKRGTARVRATFCKIRYTNNSVCHKNIDASNSGTPKQQQGISVMPLTSSMQPTARKQ